jgi:EpsI family protein
MLRKSLLISAIFFMSAVYAARAVKMEPVPIRQDFTSFPVQVSLWKGYDLPQLDKSVLEVLRVDDYLNRVYRAPDNSQAGLYIGYYRSQSQGTTMHSPLNCLPGAGWNPISRKRITIPVAHDREIPADRDYGATRRIEVNDIVIQKGLERQVVIYWYQAQGRVVASEYWGKIYTVWDAIQMNRTDAAMVRVMTPVASLDAEATLFAENKAVDFVKLVFPLLARHLPD